MRRSRSRPAALSSGPDRHRQPWPDPLRECPGPRREHEHDRRDRQQRRAGDGRAEPGDDLQLQHQQQEDDAERPVDQQRHHVRRGELAVGEQLWRHRADAATGARRRRTPRARPAPAASTASGTGAAPSAPRTVSDQVSAASAARREHGARDVQTGGRLGVPALRHVPERDDDHQRRQRQVDQEHRPPGPLHQPAADERADRSGDPAQPRPGADRRGPVRAAERRGDQRQAARGQQRAADALQGPARDEQRKVRRRPAQQRRHREPHHADHEHAAAPEPVAQRAAEQDQRGQRQGVGVDGPLQAAEARAEVRADPLQRHVDDGAVEHDHARAEHGREQHPPGRGRPHPQVGGADRFGHCTPPEVANRPSLPECGDDGRPDDAGRGGADGAAHRAARRRGLRCRPARIGAAEHRAAARSRRRLHRAAHLL